MAGEVNNVNNLTTGAAANAADQAKGKSSLGKDDFMKLMISQLKYQDPLNPMDGTQFSAQLAQFSSLEQLSNISSAMDKSINANYLLTQSINNTMSASLIGKNVKLSGGSISYNGQENMTLGYTLPVDAKSVSVNVHDKDGNLVKTFDNAELSSGDHKLSWDFSDNNGNKLSQGDYTFEVKAKGYDGKDLTPEAYKYGLIDAVRFTDQGTKLIVGKSEYDLSAVLEVIGNSNQGAGN
ncbi:MAG: flagellar hook assembly protein FlgD [Ignavibacteriales bacterium]